MTTQQTVSTLLTETEQLWLTALRARRAAAAKQREYKAALLKWATTEAKQEMKGEAE